MTQSTTHTPFLSTKKKLLSYSEPEQRIYYALVAIAHEQYPVPSAKTNRKIIRTTTEQLAGRARTSSSTMRRAVATLKEGGILGSYSTRTRGAICVYIRPPNRHKLRPRKLSTCHLREKKLNESKLLQHRLYVSDLRSKKKKEKGGGTSQTSLLRSPPRGEGNRESPTPFTPSPYYSRKHPLYYVSPAGIHAVVPGASRSGCPVVWSHEAWEKLLERLVQRGRDLWGFKRLDRRTLEQKRSQGRRFVLRYAIQAYMGREGPLEQRRKAVERELEDLVVGNFQDHRERQRKAIKVVPHAELHEVFSLRNSAEQMQRKGWCVGRGHKFVREDWVTRGRFEEATKKRMAEQRAHAAEVAKLTPADQMARVKALLESLK